MKLIRIKLSFLCFIFLNLFCSLTFSAENTLTIEWQEANLAEAIRFLANAMHMNVMISPAVQGKTTLHLQHATPMPLFNLLLKAHGLEKWSMGNIWFVVPRDELIKKKLDELKWKEINDQNLPLKTQFFILKYAKALDISHLLKEDRGLIFSKRGRILIDQRTNLICIQDNAEKLLKAKQLIEQLDKPIKQIIIAARIASVDSDFERELGINFAAKPKTAFTDDEKLSAVLVDHPNYYSFAIAKLADGSLLDVKLAALENAGHAELISSPSLFSANQETASIESGEEIPYQELSESGGTTVVFKKAVLGLKVTPQILPNNKILLQLQINQDRPSSKMVLGMPTISTRRITTNVLVKSGQTIVLGGIYELITENAQQRLPIISQIPLLGLLFKQQNSRENKRELLIFVTPRIITS